MYINKLVYRNMGPIESIDISPALDKKGNPKPLILVGENGTGKSTIISNIVDSFFEIAGKAYTNVYLHDTLGIAQYYKIIFPSEIRKNRDSMLSCIEFENEIHNKYSYLFKSGNINRYVLNGKIEKITIPNMNGKENNYKGIDIDDDTAKNFFSNNVIAYFGPDRYERPVWLGVKYYENENSSHFKVKSKFKGDLNNPIIVKNVTETNLEWLLDIIADSRSDISYKSTEENIILVHFMTLKKLFDMGQARRNIEKIMSEILGKDIYFSLNSRNNGGSRFRIINDKDGDIMAPSLDSLSTGQLALFNTFATIVRYADNNDINKSIKFDDITGIVVIDEIELHLHAKLQKEILPKLIKLFPKVQFIITTHSPLFLLGMSEKFGEENFDVYELPFGNKITVERFSEFKKAFSYMQDTQLFQNEIVEALKKESNQKSVLIVTEGSTDWKHIKAAYENLKENPDYASLFNDLHFDFLEYEPKTSEEDAEYKLDMGNKALEALCENYSKIRQTTRFIFIADRDRKDTNNKLMGNNQFYKDWGNNVFSFIIPLPKSRENTPEICIEHLYKDEDIKREYVDSLDLKSRRLYMGNEFDERGISLDHVKMCEKKKICGPRSISIIEGSSDERVTNIKDNDSVNYALPKSKFASLILSKTPPFDNMDFSNFLPIFETIKKIIEL